jgi:hypothetical protein
MIEESLGEGLKDSNPHYRRVSWYYTTFQVPIKEMWEWIPAPSLSFVAQKVRKRVTNHGVRRFVWEDAIDTTQRANLA